MKMFSRELFIFDFREMLLLRIRCGIVCIKLVWLWVLWKGRVCFGIVFGGRGGRRKV